MRKLNVRFFPSFSVISMSFVMLAVSMLLINKVVKATIVIDPSWRCGENNNKVNICHAAGLAGTTKFEDLCIAEAAVFGNNSNAGHFDENGTVLAGHQDDYFGKCRSPEVTPEVTPIPYWGIFVECVDETEDGYMARLGYKWDGKENLNLDRSTYTPTVCSQSPIVKFEPGRKTFDVNISGKGNMVWTVTALGKTKTTTSSVNYEKKCQPEATVTPTEKYEWKIYPICVTEHDEGYEAVFEYEWKGEGPINLEKSILNGSVGNQKPPQKFESGIHRFEVWVGGMQDVVWKVKLYGEEREVEMDREYDDRCEVSPEVTTTIEVTKTPTIDITQTPTLPPTQTPTPTSGNNNNDNNNNGGGGNNNNGGGSAQPAPNPTPTPQPHVGGYVPKVLGKNDIYNPLVDTLKEAWGGEVLGDSTILARTAESGKPGDVPTNNQPIEGMKLAIPALQIEEQIYKSQRIGNELAVGSEVVKGRINGAEVIYAHNGMGKFGNLYKIKPGDEVRVNSNNGEKVYKVSHTDWISETEVDKLNTAEGEIALMTCSWSNPNQRIVVKALIQK